MLTWHGSSHVTIVQGVSCPIRLLQLQAAAVNPKPSRCLQIYVCGVAHRCTALESKPCCICTCIRACALWPRMLVHAGIQQLCLFAPLMQGSPCPCPAPHTECGPMRSSMHPACAMPSIRSTRDRPRALHVVRLTELWSCVTPSIKAHTSSTPLCEIQRHVLA